MGKKGEVYTKYETNSLESSIRQSYDITDTTLSLLNEQIDDNKAVLEHIISKLKLMKIGYTYQEDCCIFTDINCLNDNREEIALIFDEYNKRVKKIQQIEKHIAKIIEQRNRNTESQYNIYCKGISILNAQEKERNRIAADLHDSVVQTLTTLVHKTELCIRMVDQDPVGVKLDLQLMMQSIKSVIDEIRCITYNLRPMAFDDLGFETTVRRFVENFEQINHVSVRFNYDCNEMKTSIVTLTLFRIIQEACSNAIKHGQADHITVTLKQMDETLILDVNDNGCGFYTKQIDGIPRPDNSGFGLSIMKERVYLLSGKINILSEINRGTRINVQVPYTIS